jgi:membrane protein DedA with SNARE-associated domain
MTLAQLLDQYGYVAVVVGTFFEGETIVVMAGFAAHQGYLHLPGVMLAAFAGSIAGDQVAFYLGRSHGKRIVARFPRLELAVQRASRLLDRYGTLLLLGFRFVYGIRNATPFTAGLTHLSVARFALLNVLGAALWSVAIGAAGYFFGGGFQLVLERARRFEEQALLVIAGLGALAALVHVLRRLRLRRRSRRAAALRSAAEVREP